MIEVTETLLQKKLERNGFGRIDETDNFALANELTVTITTAEYRELISKNAVSQYKIDEANKDKWERNSKIDSLNKEINFLKQQLLNYKLKYGELDDAGTDRE